MARSNVDAIYAEYPFLSKFMPRIEVTKAFIQRWDEDFLNAWPSWEPDYGREKLYLVEADGTIVTRVGRRVYGIYFENGSVHQTLARIGTDVDRIHYAVGAWKEFGRIMLWKLPKGYDNAGVWLRSIIEKEREELRAEG